MTDNEIIKALKVCVGIHNDCVECPLLEYSLASDECMTEVMSNALDLINRQKAEIESDSAKKEIAAECIERQDKAIVRLQNILLAFMDEVAKWENEKGIDVSELPLIPIRDESRNIIDHYRAEAIKEFAEKCKNTVYRRLTYTVDILILQNDIDDLVKEMVGETNV